MSVTFKALENILERYTPSSEHLISALQDVQAKFNYIPPEAMSAVCEYFGVSQSRAWAVATFYKSFSLQPRGMHEIKVCLGTACHLKGGARITEGLERELGVEREHTTKDLQFTLETVRCLGTCAMAPVVMIDEEYVGGANIRSLKKELKKL
ncbi:MAG: NAD(P)H-dependent oxidoreductase subunit E [Thermodesulfobacteriota bacterium]